MSVENKIYAKVKTVFNRAIKELSVDYQGSSLTDVFVILDSDTGELAIYDDEQNLIVASTIDEIAGSDMEEEQYTQIIRQVVEDLDEGQAFDSLELYKPFSINYADSSFDVIEELLLITDDSVIQFDNNILDKFDKDFDEFLDKLMKE